MALTYHFHETVVSPKRVWVRRGILRGRWTQEVIPLAGASVEVDGKVVGVTDEDGVVEFDSDKQEVEMVIRKVGFETVRTTVTA